jgi:hypothetical protein
MFSSAKFYVIVSNNSFIIKKEGDDSESTIELMSFIPNVPSYYHLFDHDKKDYISDINNQIKRLRIKNAVIVFPDDCLELEVDSRVIIEFFMQSGVKKIQESFQCFHLDLNSKKYISLSKTARALVVQYIAYSKSITKIYYDKEFKNMEQISSDMRNLHTECEYGDIPVYINNINNDMESFKSVGSMIFRNDIIGNL